mmetsp:Transcript_24441/g.68115  ORF Transcript_24441/g.68115 Transcript_24441/m.68115 type:complete len:216 (-) Transcript_24441:30-677(-)
MQNSLPQAGKILAQTRKVGLVPIRVTQRPILQHILARLQCGQRQDLGDVTSLLACQFASQDGIFLDVDMELRQQMADLVRIHHDECRERESVFPNELVHGVALARSHGTCREDDPWLRRHGPQLAVVVADDRRFQHVGDDGILQLLSFERVVAVVTVVQCFTDVRESAVEIHGVGSVVLLGGYQGGESTSSSTSGVIRGGAVHDVLLLFVGHFES